MRISDWSSDVCSSDLAIDLHNARMGKLHQKLAFDLDETFEALAQLPDTLKERARGWRVQDAVFGIDRRHGLAIAAIDRIGIGRGKAADRHFIFGCIHGPHLLCSLLGWSHFAASGDLRSEEHTSELQSLMRISYAVFCLKKTTKTTIRAAI